MKEHRTYNLAFYGNGFEYFKILLVNTILTIVTLGLYYPWAKARNLQYLYSKNTFEQTPFVFSGTGKEMFKGFIKAILILVGLYAIAVGMMAIGMAVLGVLVLYLGLLALVPLAIHGSYKYRMAKSSWQGIRFGYTGNRNQLFGIFFKGFFLTLITLGIYAAWFTINLRRYVISNVRVGNAKFVYTGDGNDYFWMNVKGYFLTLLTIGIYSFWWQKDLFNYFVNNLRLDQDDDAVFFRSTATGGGFAKLMIVNFFILVLTLGIGYAWTVTRTMNFAVNHIEMNGYYSFDSLVQSQEQYSDATGEDMADILDFGFVI